MSSGSERPHRHRSVRNSGSDETRDEFWSGPWDAHYDDGNDPGARPLNVPRHGLWDVPMENLRIDENTAWSAGGDDDIPHRGASASEHAREAENDDETDGRLDWLARHVAVILTLLFDESDYSFRDLERQWHRIVEDATYDPEAPVVGSDEFLDYMTRTYGVERGLSGRWVSHWKHVPRFDDL